MTTQLLPENSSLAADVSSPPLALCIREQGKAARTVPITEDKCTIGSGPRCHVCLSHPEIQPLHCVIVQRQGEAIVTRWSAARCHLNGRDFSTSSLHAGDRLTLGDVELEVVPAADTLVANESELSVPREEPESSEGHDSTEQRLKYLAKANRMARIRCRGLVVSLRDAREGKSSLRSQAEKLESELTQCHGELAELTGELELARNGWEQTQQAISEHAARVEQLQLVCDELTSSRDDLTAQQSASEAERQELANQLAEREHRLGELSGELESARSSREESEQSAAAQRMEIERLQWELGELASARDELAAQQSASEAERQELADQLAEREHRLGELNGERDILVAKVEKLEATQTANEQQQEALQKVLSDRDSRIEQLLGDLESIRNEQEQTQQSMEEQAGQVDRLQSELSELSTARSRWLAEQAVSDQRCQELETALSGQEEGLAELNRELETARIQREQADQVAAVQKTQREQLQAELGTLEIARESWESELTRAEQRLREMETGISEREERLNELTAELVSSREQVVQLGQEADGRMAEYQLLRDERQDLLGTVEKLGLSQSASEDQQQALQQVLSDRNDRIEQLLGELEASRSEREQTQQVVDEQGEVLEKLQAEMVALTVARGQLVSDRTASQQRLEEMEKVLSGRDQHLEQVLGELETARLEIGHESDDRLEQLQRQCDEMARQLEEFNRPENKVAPLADEALLAETLIGKADSTSMVENSDRKQASSAPVSFIEQYRHLLDEDGPSESGRGAGPTGEASPRSLGPDSMGLVEAESTQMEENGDAVLKTYMSSMMQRVCGDSTMGQEELACERTPAAPDCQQVGMPEFATTETVRPIEGDSFKQTVKNPDMAVDITAMRELANHSADQAIATYQQQNETHAIFSKLVYGGIALSMALLLILHAEQYSDPAFLGGCLAAMAGFYWVFGLCVTLLQMIRTGSEAENRE